MINLLFGGGYTPSGVIYPTCCFFNKYAVLFYYGFILLLSLSYTDHLVSIILFNYDYLNYTAILLCLCFNSLYYHFVNLNFICNNNNLYRRLSFHFTYDTDEEIRDFEIRCDIDVALPSHLHMVAAVSLFGSSSAQLRANEDLERPECSNYC